MSLLALNFHEVKHCSSQRQSRPNISRLSRKQLHDQTNSYPLAQRKEEEREKTLENLSPIDKAHMANSSGITQDPHQSLLRIFARLFRKGLSVCPAIVSVLFCKGAGSLKTSDCARRQKSENRKVWD